jgi:NO-binding membrane sensor protein with MHYT domain
MDTMSHHYNLFLVALSYVISVLGSFTALKLCRQHAGARGAEKWRSLLASALVMGLAVCGMHYTGMKAAIMRHDPALPAQVVGLSPEILAYVIFLVTLVILSLASLLGGNRQAVAIRRTA